MIVFDGLGSNFLPFEFGEYQCMVFIKYLLSCFSSTDQKVILDLGQTSFDENSYFFILLPKSFKLFFFHIFVTFNDFIKYDTSFILAPFIECKATGFQTSQCLLQLFLIGSCWFLYQLNRVMDSRWTISASPSTHLSTLTLAIHH